MKLWLLVLVVLVAIPAFAPPNDTKNLTKVEVTFVGDDGKKIVYDGEMIGLHISWVKGRQAHYFTIRSGEPPAVTTWHATEENWKRVMSVSSESEVEMPDGKAAKAMKLFFTAGVKDELPHVEDIQVDVRQKGVPDPKRITLSVAEHGICRTWMKRILGI